MPVAFCVEQFRKIAYKLELPFSCANKAEPEPNERRNMRLGERIRKLESVKAPAPRLPAFARFTITDPDPNIKLDNTISKVVGAGAEWHRKPDEIEQDFIDRVTAEAMKLCPEGAGLIGYPRCMEDD